MPHSVPGNSEGPGILDLPFEILLKIFQNIQVYTGSRDDRSPESVNDIKNCRLTCRRFNEAGSQLLVPTLEIDCSLKSLDKIEQIANHPIISKGVRTVQVCLREYPMDISRHINDFILSSTLMLHQAIAYTKEEAKGPNDVWRKRFPILLQEPGRLEESRRLVETWNRIFFFGDRGVLPEDEDEDDDDLLPDVPSKKPQAGDTLHRRLATQALQEYETLHYIQKALLEDRDEDDDHGIPQFLPRIATALASLPRLRNLAFTLTSPTKIHQKTWGRLLTDTATDLNTIVYKGILLEPADGRFMRLQSISPSLGHVIPRLIAKLSDARHLHPNHTPRLEMLDIQTDDIDIRSFAMSPSMLSKISSELRLLKSFSFSAMSQRILINLGEPILVGSTETAEDSAKIAHIINEDIMNDLFEIPLASPALECFDVTLTPPPLGSDPPHALTTLPEFLNIGPALLSRKAPFTGANKNIRLFRLSGVSFHEEDLVAFLETIFPRPDSSSSSISPTTAPQDAPTWPPIITTDLKLIKTRLLSGKWSTALASLRDARRRIGPDAMFMVREPQGCDLVGWDPLRLSEAFGPEKWSDGQILRVYTTWPPTIRYRDDIFGSELCPYSPCWEYLNEHLATEAYIMNMYFAQERRRPTFGQLQHQPGGRQTDENGGGRWWTVEEIRELLMRNPRVFPNPVFWDPDEAGTPLPFSEMFGGDN